MITSMNMKECANKEWSVRRNSVVTIANIKLDDHQRWIHVSSDSSKTYCSIVFGMVGEGVLAVGYSSVNGSASENMHPDCLATMAKAANDYVVTHPDYPEAKDTWLLYLSNMATAIDAAFNSWLGSNQDKF